MAKYSKCPYQCVEGGLIGEYIFPDCIGKTCACYIVYSGICLKTGQNVFPNEVAL